MRPFGIWTKYSSGVYGSPNAWNVFETQEQHSKDVRNFLGSKALFCEETKMTMVEKAQDIVAGLLIVKVSNSARIFSNWPIEGHSHGFTSCSIHWTHKNVPLSNNQNPINLLHRHAARRTQRHSHIQSGLNSKVVLTKKDPFWCHQPKYSFFKQQILPGRKRNNNKKQT